LPFFFLCHRQRSHARPVEDDCRIKGRARSNIAWPSREAATKLERILGVRFDKSFDKLVAGGLHKISGGIKGADAATIFGPIAAKLFHRFGPWPRHTGPGQCAFPAGCAGRQSNARFGSADTGMGPQSPLVDANRQALRYGDDGVSLRTHGRGSPTGQ